MNVLVINCGSSSLKYQVLDMRTESLLAKGLVERIGIEGSLIIHEKTGDNEKFKLEVPMANHTEAIAHVLEAVTHPEHGVVKSMMKLAQSAIEWYMPVKNTAHQLLLLMM